MPLAVGRLALWCRAPSTQCTQCRREADQGDHWHTHARESYPVGVALATRAVRGRIPQADTVHRERSEGCHARPTLPPGRVTVQVRVLEAAFDRARNHRAAQLGRAAGFLREQPLHRLLHRAMLGQRLADVAHYFLIGTTGIAR
eukprot:scaffold85035_cov64-Phaeocystis_antarctica.AAC.3